MAIYANAPSAQTVYNFSSATVPFAGLISAWPASLSANTNQATLSVDHQTFSVSGNITAEKLSTRSIAPSSNWFNSNSSFNNRILSLSMRTFCNNFWRAQPRACPWCDETNLLSINTTNGQGTATIDEDIQGHNWRIRGRRRCREPGFWNMSGNDTIQRIAVTGGGAFNARYPTFQNDLTWVDPSAWRNGSASSDSRDTSALTPSLVLRARTLLGVGL